MWAPNMKRVAWGGVKKRESDAESKPAAGTLASGDMVKQAAPGRDTPRDRRFTDLDRIQDERVRAMTNTKIALKIRIRHLEFGSVLDFGEIEVAM